MELPIALAAGTELLGEFHGSGRVPTPYLIRRGDGRMLEVSPVLYAVAASLDGGSGLDDAARRVGAALHRNVSADSVDFLIERKLRPLGIIGGDVGQPPKAPPAPVLALSIRAGAVPAAAVRRLARVFRPLFFPPVVVALLGALAVIDVDLVLGQELGTATDGLASRPGELLLVVALTLVAGLFHELGHATASRYGGAEPGAVGVGIYLLWPVFYNDLNDSYRLSRRGRLRADLGGVYFNIVFIVVLAALHRVTGYPPLLAAIVVQHLAIAQQFLPFVRLDGYYIVSDLAGVPDLFGRIRPTVRSIFGKSGSAGAPADLTPRARAIVTAWVLATVPLLGGLTVLLVAGLPSLVAGAWQSLGNQVAVAVKAAAAGEPASALLGVVGAVIVAVPLAGLGGLVVRSAVAVGRRMRRATRPKPASRHRSPSQRTALPARTVLGASLIAYVGWWALRAHARRRH